MAAMVTHFSKISLYERRFQIEWDFGVQFRLFDYFAEFIVVDRSVAICVEQLEGGLVQRVRCAQQTFECLEFGK